MSCNAMVMVSMAGQCLAVPSRNPKPIFKPIVDDIGHVDVSRFRCSPHISNPFKPILRLPLYVKRAMLHAMVLPLTSLRQHSIYSTVDKSRRWFVCLARGRRKMKNIDKCQLFFLSDNISHRNSIEKQTKYIFNSWHVGGKDTQKPPKFKFSSRWT